MYKKAIILFNNVDDSQAPDVLDALVQVDAVKNALKELGYRVNTIDIEDDLTSCINEVIDIEPDIVCNLVESFAGQENLMHLPVHLLEMNNISVTGASAETIFITTNKVTAKKIMQGCNILTPAWFLTKLDNKFKKGCPYILKPVSADASVGIDAQSIVENVTKSDLQSLLAKRSKKFKLDFFAEEFIEGREFNIAMIEVSSNLTILPVSEIEFTNWKEDMPKIVDYEAKWQEDSDAYKRTLRSFNAWYREPHLMERLMNMAQTCWYRFNLSGYARVDCRVDMSGNVYVIEINANPCISPDSGFVAACIEYGFSYKEMIENIVMISRKKE